MTFRLFGNSGSYKHYQDDGVDFEYENGQYNLYQVTVTTDGEASVTLTNNGFAPVYKYIYLELPNKKLTFEYDEKK
ncbi:DUF5110 domain-containing protein [Paucilactobacillus hokkaidonensis]|uniref:DUF5110 domain-containing protein n=1 Tax=Paucilactobacillus hokkaidonensis TaxID=1193095 RepID=UPI0020922E2B|nr:DUF5110 domain-containing protein [Paucilactobacillus hokkaidonensis]